MINKLVNKITKTHAPIVVGLDPMLNYVPEHVQKAAFAEYGETLEGAAEAIWQFNKEIIDKTYDLIPAVKPQIAISEHSQIRIFHPLRRLTCQLHRYIGRFKILRRNIHLFHTTK